MIKNSCSIEIIPVHTDVMGTLASTSSLSAANGDVMTSFHLINMADVRCLSSDRLSEINQ